MSDEYGNLIVDRETKRQQTMAEERTARILIVAAAACVSVLIGGLIYVWVVSINTPDPQQIAPGTTIDCVVKE